MSHIKWFSSQKYIKQLFIYLYTYIKLEPLMGLRIVRWNCQSKQLRIINMSRCSHICNKWTSTNPPTSTIYGPALLPKFTVFNLPESTQPEDASTQVSAIPTTHFLEIFLKNKSKFSIIFYYLPLKEGVALYFYNLEFPSPDYTL